MKQYHLTLDLVDDPALIEEYEAWHRAVWPEVQESILSAGINRLSIYRSGNRLVMYMETSDTFSFDQKAAADALNPRVQEWETLMWKYQQRVPWAAPGQKWVLMQEIYSLKR